MERTLATPIPLRAPQATMDSASRSQIEMALSRLYDEHAAGIYRFCLGMFGRKEDAEDAIQALWLQLAKNPGATLAATEPAAYLWAIARNLVKSRLRRRALEFFWTPAPADPAELLAVAEGPADASAEARRELARAVAKLRPRLRELVLLVGIEGFTLEEAAARLSIPRGTAASRYHAATVKLRQLLGER